jgi:carbon-monoxide dehydrogenase medium subunit
MKAPAFRYARPRTLAEAYELLEHYGEEARILAGGQSLLAALNMRLAAPRVLVDINGLEELSGIRAESGRVRIGALTRHRTLERSAEIARLLPLVHEAMPHVAHAAIRNRGTFGGSVALADPAAELPACSVALGADFVIGSSRGERRVPAREFFKGLYETDLRPGEILLAGEFPAAAPGWRYAFEELARRHGDFALVGVAACARGEGGLLRDVGLVFFGLGGAPVRARAAARAIEGRACTRETVAEAQAALERELPAYGDLHASGAARLHLARVLLGRALQRLAAQ